jgi:hypothetical protein
MEKLKSDQIIDHFSKPPLDCHFDGEDLVYAMGRTKWLVDAIEATNYVDESLRLFRNNHRQKNYPVIWCYMLAVKMECQNRKQLALRHL